MTDIQEKPVGDREENLIIGRNAILEALRSDRTIDSLYVARGNRAGAISALLAKAKAKGIVIKEADPKKLDFLCGHANHQGVVAVASVKAYATLDDLFRLAEERGEPPFFIIADGLHDPHNLGAVIRTAECAGAHGVIVPKRHSTGLTYAVGKASAGAVEYLPVARVSNLAAAMDELKKRGVWIYAADMDGERWCDVDYSGAVALVVGSEGDGVGRLVKEKSDFIVSLPIRGNVNSLNASVACGILCYEVVRSRMAAQAK
ncbi:23S rRNA (guanosine(2251)-2'-O)-methyltransferase RlmB [Yeguia hominis]|uniref:23S rRNA (guanosine(2251)-2'-O)-methyltransferase RlmB n=1 Tax=Yeguia hominis TaxID=2763662 RepID=UPI002016328A